MLDVLDFIAERGGDPKKIVESQKRRYADEAIVQEIADLWQDAYKSRCHESNNSGVKTDTMKPDIKQHKSVLRSTRCRRRLAS